jgi:hypothetical protein
MAFPDTMTRRRWMRSTTSVDGLESTFAEGYTDEQWQSIADHLGEHVQNGLTSGPASDLS